MSFHVFRGFLAGFIRSVYPIWVQTPSLIENNRQGKQHSHKAKYTNPFETNALFLSLDHTFESQLAALALVSQC